MQLFVVATPIGNLFDLTERARTVLSSTKLLFAEDTRVAAKLLAHIGARPRVLALHHHSDSRALVKAIAELVSVNEAALITDAGTPGISDPGNIFIQELLRCYPETVIIPVPGPSAVTAALSVCGFPTDHWRVFGFPPHKNKRAKFFSAVAVTNETAVLFESVHRIKKTLIELDRVLGVRPIMLGRELTKIHETIYRGSAAVILKNLPDKEIKGEFVIVISASK